MERVLLYLDDIDDFVYACALIGERLLRLLLRLGWVATLLTLQCAFVLLAVELPALGAAAAALLTVLLLYRSATMPARPVANPA